MKIMERLLYITSSDHYSTTSFFCTTIIVLTVFFFLSFFLECKEHHPVVVNHVAAQTQRSVPAIFIFKIWSLNCIFSLVLFECEYMYDN